MMSRRATIRSSRSYPSICFDPSSRDCWPALGFMVVHLSMILFVLYTSWSQNQIERDRQEALEQAKAAEATRLMIAEELAEQNTLLLCTTSDSHRFYLVVIDYLIVTADEAGREQSKADLQVIRDRLQRATDQRAPLLPEECNE